MSLKTVTRVWADTKQSGSALLMLLAIADFADDDGVAYPSVATLAAKCRMKVRNAQTLLAAPRESGEVEVRENAGPRGTNVYRITRARGVQTAAQVRAPAAPQEPAPKGAKACAKPLQGSAYKQSLNRQEPERGRAATSSGSGPGSERGSRLPADWQPSETDLAFCREHRPDLEPQHVVATFRDHWASKTGKDATKQDWPATWRNWVRRERAPLAGAMGAPRRKPVLHADDILTEVFA